MKVAVACAGIVALTLACAPMRETSSEKVASTRPLHRVERVESSARIEALLAVEADEIVVTLREARLCRAFDGETVTVETRTERRPDRGVHIAEISCALLGAGMMLPAAVCDGDGLECLDEKLLAMAGVLALVPCGIAAAVDASPGEVKTTSHDEERGFPSLHRCDGPLSLTETEVRLPNGATLKSSTDHEGVARFQLEAETWEALGPRFSVEVASGGNVLRRVELERK